MIPHPLISMLVGAFVTAFLFGLIAKRLGIAPIVGFLLAGVVIGPFTPGFVADRRWRRNWRKWASCC